MSWLFSLHNNNPMELDHDDGDGDMLFNEYGNNDEPMPFVVNLPVSEGLHEYGSDEPMPQPRASECADHPPAPMATFKYHTEICGMYTFVFLGNRGPD